MKKIFFALVMILPLISLGQESTTSDPAEVVEVKWMTLEEAIEAQSVEKKKIFIDVYTKWCGPCKMLDKNTFHNADVVEYLNDNYYAVKFDAESPDAITYKGQEFTNDGYDPNKTGRNSVHDLSRAFKVSAYPTMMFLDEEANVISPVTGYLKPTQIELYLKLFASDAYTNLDTEEKWKQYQLDFVGEFTD